MKALVYTAPETLQIRDLPTPEPAAGEALIKVEAVGICGSDMHAYFGHDARRPAPLILGHEAAGEIISINGSYSGFDVGKRVTINPLVTCQSCTCCKQGRTNLCPDRQIISMPPREGAFAEYITMPVENLVALPDHIDSQTGCLVEPLSCGWHAVKLVEEILFTSLGDAKCCVLGGGAIGLGAALCLRAFGAKDIIISEPNPLRHKSLELENFLIVSPQDEIMQKAHFDVIIDAVGFTVSREQACLIANPGAVIAHIGLGQADGGLDPRRMTLQEITFIGTYTYTMDDFLKTSQALFDGRLGKLDWFETRQLKAGPQAFLDLKNDVCVSPKIILAP